MEPARVVAREDATRESELLGLGDPFVDLAHGPDLAAQADLADGDGTRIDRDVPQARHDGKGHAEIDRGFIDPDAPRDIDEDVVLSDTECPPASPSTARSICSRRGSNPVELRCGTP